MSKPGHIRKWATNYLIGGLSSRDEKRALRNLIFGLYDATGKTCKALAPGETFPPKTDGREQPAPGSLRGKYIHRASFCTPDTPVIAVSCINRHLPDARTLAAGIKESLPHVCICLVLGEAPPADFSLAGSPFDELMLFDDFDIPDYGEWLFTHTEAHAFQEIKGYILEQFLIHEKRRKVIVIDPCVELKGSLEPLIKALDDHSLFLVAKQSSPSLNPVDELPLLQNGAYTGSIFGVTAGEAGIAFISWLKNRWEEHWETNAEKWLDLAPSLFDGVFLADRATDALSISLPPAKNACDIPTWIYSEFSDGMKIPDDMKRARKFTPSSNKLFANPFDVSDCPCFRTWSLLHCEVSCNKLFARLCLDRPTHLQIVKFMAAENHPALIIDHSWGGGANAYRQKKIKQLLDEGKTVLLATWSPWDRATLTFFHRKKQIKLNTDSLMDLVWCDLPRIETIIVNEVASWQLPRELSANVNTLYIKDTAFILDQIKELAQRNNAKIEFLFHDFFSLCPNITMLNDKMEYCRICKDEQTCQGCLRGLEKPELSISAWRQAWQSFFNQTDRILFFSRSTLDIAREIFSLPDDIVTVTPHQPLIKFDKKVNVPASGPMVVAIAGHIQDHKGGKIVAELGELLAKQHPTAKIVIFGKLDYPASTKNISESGAYQLKDLPDLMSKHRVTIGCLPSIWPETFSYVTQEFMALELPTVCFNIGAPAERLGAWDKGLVVDSITAQDLLDGLLRLDSLRTS